jgi:kynureninase
MIDLGPFPDTDGHTEALELDAADPLYERRRDFVHADPELIYLDGNSLGMLTSDARDAAADVIDRQWGERLIRSWNEGWWEMQLEVGDLIAPLIGAQPGEVIMSDSTSVNLYKLAIAALQARPDRTRILTDDLNFPTDVYVLDGIAELLDRGHRVERVPSPDGIHGPIEEIEAILASDAGQDVALVSLSATCFKSAYTYDVGRITRAAHAAGAMVLWDLSHTAGSVDVDLGAAGVDLAVGCTYKYLNGGPGSPAFLYVHRDLQDQLGNPIHAWWAHADPFAMDLDFAATEGVRRFHTGTMPILSLATARAGIAHVAEVGIGAIREKSVALTEYFVRQTDTHLAPRGFELASPRDPRERGSHISVSHSEAWPVTRTLVEHAKVIPDFRAPDLIRFGLSPLTTTFEDVHTAIQRCARIVASRAHRDVDIGDRPVT